MQPSFSPAAARIGPHQRPRLLRLRLWSALLGCRDARVSLQIASRGLSSPGQRVGEADCARCAMEVRVKPWHVRITNVEFVDNDSSTKLSRAEGAGDVRGCLPLPAWVYSVSGSRSWRGCLNLSCLTHHPQQRVRVAFLAFSHSLLGPDDTVARDS